MKDKTCSQETASTYDDYQRAAINCHYSIMGFIYNILNDKVIAKFVHLFLKVSREYSAKIYK